MCQTEIGAIGEIGEIGAMKYWVNWMFSPVLNLDLYLCFVQLDLRNDYKKQTWALDEKTFVTVDYKKSWGPDPGPEQIWGSIENKFGAMALVMILHTYLLSVQINIITFIITIYFENTSFFHAELGLDNCPRVNMA